MIHKRYEEALMADGLRLMLGTNNENRKNEGLSVFVRARCDDENRSNEGSRHNRGKRGKGL